MKKSPAEIKQERLDRQAARRKKQEDKAAKKKEKVEKAEQEHQEGRLKAEAAEKAISNGDDVEEGSEVEVHDDHRIQEPDTEPAKVKREAHTHGDMDEEPILERETSGLAHLRRRRLIDVNS